MYQLAHAHVIVVLITYTSVTGPCEPVEMGTYEGIDYTKQTYKEIEDSDQT